MGELLGRYPVGRHPYGVAVAGGGIVYVSAWGGWTVSVFVPAGWRTAAAAAPPGHQPPVGLPPQPSGARLFVASASTDRVAAIILGPVSDWSTLGARRGPEEEHPEALALLPDGPLLYVAERRRRGRLFALCRQRGYRRARPATTARRPGPGGLVSHLLAAVGDSLLVRARRDAPPANPDSDHPSQHSNKQKLHPGPARRFAVRRAGDHRAGSSTGSTRPRASPAPTRWDQQQQKGSRTRPTDRCPQIEHMIYIIKDNRTYDQVFGDLEAGDRDTTLIFFPGGLARPSRAGRALQSFSIASS